MRWPRFPRRRRARSEPPGRRTRARPRAHGGRAARGPWNHRSGAAEGISPVERHDFVEGDEPYGDHALPVGSGQTISQPYIVARMTRSAGRPAAGRERRRPRGRHRLRLPGRHPGRARARRDDDRAPCEPRRGARQRSATPATPTSRSWSATARKDGRREGRIGPSWSRRAVLRCRSRCWSSWTRTADAWSCRSAGASTSS